MACMVKGLHCFSAIILVRDFFYHFLIFVKANKEIEKTNRKTLSPVSSDDEWPCLLRGEPSARNRASEK